MKTTRKNTTRDYYAEAERIMRERREAAALAVEARLAKDVQYRRALGVSLTAPLPATIGKAESNGRPLFTHRGLGERHATTFTADRLLGERTD